MDISLAVVEVIQAMLAPGLMISACGLLLLSMNNKYSLVVNRIRLLGEERRRFSIKASEREFLYQEEVRLKSISIQLDKLKYRVKMVRNAVFSYSLAVALFVITSMQIGASFILKSSNFETLVIVSFSIGMFLVLVGICFAAIETIKGYEIISYETKADE
ncbi:MAG: DUF2721 domain-containing protein [Ignavibacteria bacterium]|nr:DUF2721 domain-containing protein [Ignavibacteria bacterium]MDP3684478.1 DUF2721 domain-containing protein [Ignavibacteria bacterium]